MNESLSSCEFPYKLKLADVTPVFKEKNPLDKVNYRPVSVLPPISKIYEKLLQKQINNYMKLSYLFIFVVIEKVTDFRRKRFLWSSVKGLI